MRSPATAENWLSQDGDWGLTFDAQPLLNYAGNLFNGNSSNGGAALTWANPMVRHPGKKLVRCEHGLPWKLRIGFGSNKTTELVPQVGSPDNTVEDVTKVGGTNIVLVPASKACRQHRVVGVYGAEAYVALVPPRPPTSTETL